MAKKVAEASGIFGARVEKPEELRPALAQALQYDGPALVEVIDLAKTNLFR
jgi:pyruvate dehydrogenase (quinone)